MYVFFFSFFFFHFVFLSLTCFEGTIYYPPQHIQHNDAKCTRGKSDFWHVYNDYVVVYNTVVFFYYN